MNEIVKQKENAMMNNGMRILKAVVLAALTMSMTSCLSMLNYHKVDQRYQQKSSQVEFHVTTFSPSDKVTYGTADLGLRHVEYVYAAKEGTVFDTFIILAKNAESSVKHLPLDAVSVTMADGRSFGPTTTSAHANGSVTAGNRFRNLGEHDVVDLEPNETTLIQISFMVPQDVKLKSINFFGEALPISGEKLE